MTQLYQRRASISLVDSTTGELYLLVRGDREEGGRAVRGLRMTFKIHQALYAIEDTAECEIYNLGETSRAAAGRSENRGKFIVEAGYEGALGTIFKGQARKIVSIRQPTGFVTKINAIDGFQARRVVNQALAPGARVSQAIEAIATAMQVDATKALKSIRAGKFDRAYEVYSHGLTLAGTARTEMDRLASTHGFEWAIVHGALEIQLPREASTETAVVLSPETGMVGGPSRALDVKRGRRVIVQVKSLLQPGLRPGRRVELRSRDISGSFKVYNVDHTGDTDNVDWFSDCDLLEVK